MYNYSLDKNYSNYCKHVPALKFDVVFFKVQI